MKSRARWLVPLLLALALNSAAAASSPIDELLSAAQSPDGVVFEIMAWRDHSWDWAVPRLSDYIMRLRARFPELEFALISHGAELFELTRAAGLAERPAIRELARLGSEGLAVHVDGAFAQWKRLGQRDFLDFVDVSPSADAQLADYIKLGFTHIRLEAPDATDG